MTLTLKISGDKEAAPQARAREQGVSAEQLAQQILNRELEGRAAPGPATRGRHISERIREIMSDAPPEAFEGIPQDGASEHDHYIYGTPKRNP